MKHPSPNLLLLLILALSFSTHSHQNPNPSLILPLKTQWVPSTSCSKLPFHRNVSLTVSLTVGLPPQTVSMVIDTGSELSWLNCNQTRLSSSSFDPNRSTSYRPISCSDPTCTTRTRDLSIPASCDESDRKSCHVTLTYADFSSSEGSLAADVFSIGNAANSGLVFGCMGSVFEPGYETGSGYITGLMGMNRGELSFISQMAFPKFSYCISGSDFSGVLLLGEANFSWVAPLNYTPLIQISTPLPYFDRVAYTVHLEGIKVGSKQLNIPGSEFEPDHTGAGQTMVDSGTQFTFLLGSVYTILRSEFLNQTDHILRVYEDPDFVFQAAMDLCYRVGSAQTTLPDLPTVTLMFRGAEMKVTGKQLLYRVRGETRGNDSLWCFTFGNSDLLGVEAFLIGHHHQQDLWVEYDLTNSRIGLAEVQCDLAGQKFGLTG